MDVEVKYSRFKGAGWFPWLLNRDVILGGAGGISSWVSILLSRLGCNIYIYDFDKFEEHNMGGQLVGAGDIGYEKTDVAIKLASAFSNHYDIEAMGKYTEESETCPIMMCGFDNMKARTIMFNNWKTFLTENPESKKESIFIDGRLIADQYQIFCILGTKEDHIKRYEEDFLFSDSEVEAVDCTFKQTSHGAAGIASKMIGFLTNHALNNVLDSEVAIIPFNHEYITNSNTTIDVI